jgi:hypothetical protein
MLTTTKNLFSAWVEAAVVIIMLSVIAVLVLALIEQRRSASSKPGSLPNVPYEDEDAPEFDNYFRMSPLGLSATSTLQADDVRDDDDQGRRDETKQSDLSNLT